jgi:hypothetical protein
MAAMPPGPAPAAAPSLRLYTREGCCLCEGLQERLAALRPEPRIELHDVDRDPGLQARYGLRVPVLACPCPPAPAAGPPAAPGAVDGDPVLGWRELPPVPPRLSGERLQAWLRDHGAVAGAAAPGGPPSPEHL